MNMKRAAVFSLSYVGLDLISTVVQVFTSAIDPLLVWKISGGFAWSRVLIDVVAALVAFLLMTLSSARARNHLSSLITPSLAAGALIGRLWFGPLLSSMLWSYAILTFIAFSATVYLVLWAWSRPERV